MRKQVFAWLAVGAGAVQIVQSIANFKAFRNCLFEIIRKVNMREFINCSNDHQINKYKRNALNSDAELYARFSKTLPDRFLDSYIPIKILGEGEMGTVLMVKNRRMGQIFAAKIAVNEKYRKRLKQEGERLKELHHRIFPYITDFIETDHCSILIMEYIEGISFEEYLEQYVPLTENEAVCKILEIAEILNLLHYMHPKIIFQDLKPSNLIIQPDGRLRLIDFGTALCGHLSIDTEYYMGTDGYSAPEQKCGKNINETSDIYSLGALFSYMVSGVDPGKPPYQIAELEKEPVIVSVKVQKIIRDCCREDQNQRIENTDEFIRRIKQKSYENWMRSLSKVFSCMSLSLAVVYTYLYLFIMKYDSFISIVSKSMFYNNIEFLFQSENFRIITIVICFGILLKLVISNQIEKNGFIRKRKVNIVCSEKRTRGLY